jgi:hypothetical protein
VRAGQVLREPPVAGLVEAPQPLHTTRKGCSQRARVRERARLILRHRSLRLRLPPGARRLTR